MKMKRTFYTLFICTGIVAMSDVSALGVDVGIDADANVATESTISKLAGTSELDSHAAVHLSNDTAVTSETQAKATGEIGVQDQSDAPDLESTANLLNSKQAQAEEVAVQIEHSMDIKQSEQTN